MILPIFMPLIILIATYLTCMVALVQIKKDMSIANFVWGGGCFLIALYTFLMQRAHTTRSIILTMLIVLWSSRLILYVYLRYKGNDPRFTTWKQSGLKALIVHIGYIFGLQTLLMMAMATPIVLINMSTQSNFSYLDYLGILIWLIGYCFEAISDYQLFHFTNNPANQGHVIQSGLWHYSRHPNYFGEVLMWWGIFLLALSTPFGLYAISAPLTITFLLLFVTGIPWIEKAMEKNPEYQEYKKHTSIFIPWFPKK